MKRLLSAAALVSAVAFCTPASAANALQFYDSCGTDVEAGFVNRPYCHAYLEGFFDAMSATSQICPSSDVNVSQIVIVVQYWLRSHSTTLKYPAHVIIRNAMINEWPCRRY